MTEPENSDENLANKKTSRKPKQQKGDEIHLDEIGEGSAIAAGRGAKAVLNRVTLNFPNIDWLPVIIALLAIIGVMAALFWQISPKKPAKMQGLFNIAVSGFTVLGQDGKPQNSQEGVQLADFMARRMDLDFKKIELDKSIQYELWGPQNTGSIVGSMPEQRAASASALAQNINAQVLIYGVIQIKGESASFEPEFYVNYNGFEGGEEITGQNRLGSPIRLKYPIDFVELEHLENPALIARTQALIYITRGLAYYSADNFGRAREQFQEAVKVEGWSDSSGKEVAYLLLGNTDLRQISKTSQEITSEEFQKLAREADQSYSTALEINPEFARAATGQASVLYLRAVGDPSTKQMSVDSALLADAEKAYQEALSLQDAPSSANIPTKVHFGLGQIYFTRAQVLNEPLLEKAQNEFSLVVKDFDQGNTSVRDLASHAFARLGWIARQMGDTKAAVSYVQRAVKIASPYYQGRYQALLGDIYLSTNDVQLAREAYQTANEIASSNGDEDTVRQTENILKSIKLTPTK